MDKRLNTFGVNVLFHGPNKGKIEVRGGDRVLALISLRKEHDGVSEYESVVIEPVSKTGYRTQFGNTNTNQAASLVWMLD